MRKQNFKPYGIDISYEYKTYRHVGKDYGDSKNANLGWLFNARRFLRKHWNKGQTKYCKCDTYSDWECHVKKIVREDIINRVDLIHWLYDKRNGAIEMLDAVKNILIPIYIAMFSMLNFFDNEEISESSVYFILAIIVFASVKYLIDATEKVNFYNDLLEILKK